MNSFIGNEAQNFSEKFIDKFNPSSDDQLMFLVEECGELIQAASKVKRGKEGSMDNLKEEMMDVIICITILCQLLDINPSGLYRHLIDKKNRYDISL